MPIYQLLSERFDTLLILSGREDNRRWEQERIPGVCSTVAWGITWKRTVRTSGGGAAEERYLHINPGYVRELIRFRPHAIVTGEMGFRSLVAVLYGLVARVPVWLWWEGTAHNASVRDRSPLKRALRRFFFAKLVRRWIAFGVAATAYLASLGVPPARIVQVQNPVDECLFHKAVAPYPLPPDLPLPRALFVGRLIEWKGIYPLLEAAATLQEEGFVFSLVVVGDGPEAERIGMARERLDIQHVHSIRHLPAEVMPSIYRACDFLVFPSLDEIWGLVVNEALLSGLPVIASIYAGATEDLVPVENRFDPASQASFVRVLRRALENRIAAGSATPIRPIRGVAEAIAVDVARRIAVPSADGGTPG